MKSVIDLDNISDVYSLLLIVSETTQEQVVKEHVEELLTKIKTVENSSTDDSESITNSLIDIILSLMHQIGFGELIRYIDEFGRFRHRQLPDRFLTLLI
jgi:hypothetical protein